MPDGFSAADTGWVLVSSALVFIMIPGLALFYGGMTKARSTLNMMMMTFASLAVVTVLWAVYGFAEAFGEGTSPFIGKLGTSHLDSGINVLAVNGTTLTIPVVAFAAFQLMFAAITPALISGALADRAKFATWALFVALWSTLVYFPVAHWVFSFGSADGTGAGWLAHLGVLDFAGGTAVHINAGAAALALVLVLGRRLGWGKDRKPHPAAISRPHNLPVVFIGAGLLWFGWFGFNAGSALAVNGIAALAFFNTTLAAAAAACAWAVVERFRDGHFTTLGAVSGGIAGLVAITPACAFVGTYGALAIGLLAGAVCAYAVSWKYRIGYDDTLDVVGVHLVGGIVGSLAVGIFASKAINAAGADGLLAGGGFTLLGKQAVGVAAVGFYSFAVTLLLGWLLNKTIGFRVSPEAESAGIDTAEHAETAYELGAGLHAPDRRATTPASSDTLEEVTA